jgi:hypothetical protein
MEWYLSALYRSHMPNDMPETFTRRMRLSSVAILTAVALTLAALIATMITSHETSHTVVKTTGPVTQLPTAADTTTAADTNSGLLPVVNR